MKSKGSVLIAFAILAVIVLGIWLLSATSSFSQPSRPPAFEPTASKESPPPVQAQYNASSPITSEEAANQTQSNISSEISDAFSAIEGIKDILK